MRQQLSAMLSLEGFQVIEAADGELGLAAAAVASDLCLVLCDVHMPKMNGLEFVEKFRPKDRFPQVPVLMLTTDDTKDAMTRAKRAGACAWIVKPFNPALLTTAIRRIVGQAA